MSAFLKCPHGHCWKAARARRESMTLDSAVCPVCGDGNLTMTEVYSPSDDADRATKLLHHLVEDLESVGNGACQVARPEQAMPDALAPILNGYEILEELARGGMGVVYKARQKGLNRVVALKMILSGAHAGPDEVARFRVEAEAVARLQHPHIVQIHEVGDVRGLPFFSLEFVDGGSLGDKLAGVPQPPRAAAEVVAILAEAIQHAHEQGIIHRDLKPSNILLSSMKLGSDTVASHREMVEPAYAVRTTEYGLLKISDFGLAKPVRGESGLTQTGAIVGTPSYMAPEQANQGCIGPGADIYALGAILYEMLTGRPPFRANSPMETIQQVIADEPVAPGRLQPKLPVDLETICLKCLEKDPTKRYPTALALAEDLRRFLAGEPIQARPVTLVRRLAKWGKRRPALAGLVSVSSIALVALAGVTTVSAVSLKRERDFAMAQRDLATRAKEEADQQRQRAETGFERARAAVDQMLTRVGDRLKNVPHLEELQRDLLEDALKFNKQFLEDRGTDPTVRKETIRAYLRAATIRTMLGQHDQAAGAYRESITLLQQLEDDGPYEGARLQALIQSYNGLGSQLVEMNRLSEAEATYRTGLELLEGLVRRHPAIPACRCDLAALHNRLGNLYDRSGRWQEEEKCYRRALAILDSLVADFPKVPLYRRDQAMTLDFLAIRLASTQREDDAQKTFQKAVDTAAALVDEFPKEADYREDLARYQFNLASLCAERGRLQEAEQCFRKTIQSQEALVADFPRVPTYRQALVKRYYNLGLVCQQSKRYQDALAAYRQSATLGEALVAQFSKVPAYREDLGATLNNMSVVLKSMKQRSEAEKVCRQAIDTMEPVVAEFPNAGRYLSQLATHLACLADFLLDRNALPEAQRLLERAVKLRRTALERTDPNALHHRRMRANMTTLASILLLQKDYNAAAATAEDLLRTFPKHPEAEYNGACILARCAPLAEKDGSLADARRRELQHTYGEQAMAALRGAWHDGFKDVDLLKRDTDLDSLRSRTDFRELLALIEKGKP